VRDVRPVLQRVFHSVFQLGAEHPKAAEIAVTTADPPIRPKPDKGDKIERTTSPDRHTSPKTTSAVPQDT
jgi:hypothetical protein